MSNYSESEGSAAEDFNPSFKAGAYYKQAKSPYKTDTIRVVHSKINKESKRKREESEDSEYAEDEDLCDEEEKYMRDRKKQLKAKSKPQSKNSKAKQVSDSEEEQEPEDEEQEEEAEGEGEEAEGEDAEDEEGDEGEGEGEGEGEEREGDDEGEEEEDEEDEESEEVIKRELPQRQTRGKRMNVLVGKALEDDEAFWGADFFQENDEDESFDAASSEDKDSFDSDFDKSEHSNEGEGGEEASLVSAEKEVRRKERAEKKRVKFAVPAKKKTEASAKKKIVKEDKEEDKSSNTSEPLLVGSRRSKRMMERREEEDSDDESDNDAKNDKKNVNNTQKSAERKREIKEKNKAFLQSHGIEGDMQEKWSELLSKDKLTPMEKIQEAVFTEIINKESLLYLQQMENDRVNELCYKDRRPKGPSVKLVQDIKNGYFKSSMIFPNSDFYPKNFNTKKEKKKEKYYYQMNTCMITGKKAKYKDPLTLTPYANKDAFKVIRERFFQKEEDKLNMRIHIINELLNQKRDKLKRYQSFDRNLEISQEQREVIMKNAQKMQFGQYR